MHYTFAGCRLDTTRREFFRQDEEVHLSPKAYELLLLLIEHRPAVVSKDQLMTELWPGTFVVEANLPVLIGELRDALGEKSRGGSIKTHHGIGYSFASEVREKRPRGERGTAGVSRVYLDVDGRRIPVPSGASQVGREPEREVFLNDPSVSRRHARITVTATSVSIVDLDSKNGTQVNGKRITGTTNVHNGDTITFGKIQTTILISRVAASTVTLTVD